MTKRRIHLLYCLALLLEAAVFFRQVLFYPGYIFPWDFRAVHLPLDTLVAESFQRHAFPLWDPTTYCGNPVYANIQTALFYPWVLAATLASSWFGLSLLPRFLEISVAAQVSLAGVCTYALLRRLGARPAAAWIAGTMYELGCFFASQAEHMGAMQGASWLPLAWLCVVELRQGFRWRWVGALSFALAMTVFAGLPQVAVVVFGSTLAAAILLALFRLARRTLPLSVLAAWIWALLLAAVQILPTAQLTQQSVARHRAEWLGTGGGIPWQALFSLVIPNYWSVFDLSKFHGPADPTFLYLYSSILGLVFAVLAICWKPDRRTRAVSILTLAAAIWMLGDSTPVGRSIFTALPVALRIGVHPQFTLCVFSLGLAMLAGLGVDRLIRSARVQIAVGVLIAADLLLVSSGRPFNTARWTDEPGSPALIARLRVLTSSATPPWRFDMTADVPYIWSSTAPLTGIPTPNGCDPLAPERVIQVRLSFAPGPRWGTCFQVVNLSSPVLRLTNARYLLSRASISNPDFRLAAEGDGYRIYENVRVLPRFFLVGSVQTATSLSGAAAALHAPEFDPSRVAIIEGKMEPVSPGGGAVDVVAYAPTAIKLMTHSAAASLLVAADTYYPGWEAAVDGKPVPLYAVDVAFRGIRVPAGLHRVEMKFVPRILYRSAILSACALLALIAAATLFRPQEL